MGKRDISRSCRHRVACRGDLAVTDQPRLYFLLSPWTHFLAPGIGQRKKQQPPRERDRQRRRERNREREGRERGEREGGKEGEQKGWREEKEKKKQQLDSPSELKLELIPSALFNTSLFLFSRSNSLPQGSALWRDILQTAALICQVMFSKRRMGNT